MDNPIKYKDLLQPDDSIEKAIQQLEQLNKAYSAFIKAIQSEASRLQTTMRGLSGSTEQYRTALQEVASQADKLARAYDELSKAQAAVQSAMDGMRQRQQAAAQASTAAAQASQSAATSVSAEAKSYKELVDSINSAIGTRSENVKRMVEEQAAISEINARLKELRKQQAAANSPAVANQISKLTNELLTHKAALSELQQSLNNTARLENAAATSMTAMSQELGRMRMAYRALTAEERNSKFGQELLATIQKADAELKRLDASIGNHQRNVGNYASGFNGLNGAIQQMGRQLPSLTAGWSSFFSVMSNNIPILANEISRARKEYEALKRSGQAGIPVWRQVVSSIISWQTALVVGITLLAMYSDKIVEWVKNNILRQVPRCHIRKPSIR